MSLENLAKIGNFHRHKAQRGEIHRLLLGLERRRADASINGLSNEGRLTAVYDSLLRLATIALRASGYRTSPEQRGQYANTLQALPLALGASADLTVQIDAFRRKRALAAYEGDDSVSDRDLAELMVILDELKPKLLKWLGKQHPELM